MKQKLVKRILAAGMAAAMAMTLLAGCGGSGSNSDVPKEQQFTWWIYKTDSDGQYYEKYEDSPVAQYLNQQYWDVENGGIAKDEKSGTKLNFSYIVPIAGSEADNFNTMIATGEYPEIIDMVSSPDSPKAMHDSGILLDITEYVEKYMPNYLAFLDENPQLKPLVQTQEEDGSIHYYAIWAFTDGVEDPWQGYCYRRDWVVKYATPSEYVWDWESDYVKENGHPAVTPLAKAKSENNLEGWKKNEVTSFSATPGDDPNETYTDNVIFPSGTSDPLTISDWEWMFEAFDKAIAERGWSEDSSAYDVTIQYYGYSQLGDITSSFGGGTGYYYTKDGEVSFDGDSENFKTYLECMNNWYNKGWLDSEFNTRSSDMFFSINTAGVNQGKVGMWCGLVSTLGTAIRTTCQDASDQQDAYVMGTALPINDVYGTEEQMYAEPDAFMASTKKGGSAIGITNKAEEKDLAALFTFFDWTYTLEGGETIRLGLNEEQYNSVKLDPDIYAEEGIKTAYTKEKDEDGKLVYKMTADPSNPLAGALIGQRMDVGLKLTGTDEYRIDRGNPGVNVKAIEQWNRYTNTGGILDYRNLLNTEESEAFSKVSQAVVDYQAQNVPNVVKGTMSWEDYVNGLKGIDPDSATKYLQKYVDLAKAGR